MRAMSELAKENTWRSYATTKIYRAFKTIP
jgi:hypothetical protein